jgi:hypothetical protein
MQLRRKLGIRLCGQACVQALVQVPEQISSTSAAAGAWQSSIATIDAHHPWSLNKACAYREGYIRASWQEACQFLQTLRSHLCERTPSQTSTAPVQFEAQHELDT